MHYGIFLEAVFSLRWEPIANVPGIPYRVHQPRFYIKLDCLEMREQELPSTVSQPVEVCRREVSFGHWVRAFHLKGLVSTWHRLAEQSKHLP